MHKEVWGIIFIPDRSRQIPRVPRSCEQSGEWKQEAVRISPCSCTGDRGLKKVIFRAHSQGQREIVSQIIALTLHLISRSHVTSRNDGDLVSRLETCNNVKCFDGVAVRE